MSAGTPTPLDVLREALALHLSMAASGEQPTAQSLSSLENGLAALSDVETLVEAARAFIGTMGIHHSVIEGREIPRGFTSGSSSAAAVLYDVLARFPGDGNERAT